MHKAPSKAQPKKQASKTREKRVRKRRRSPVPQKPAREPRKGRFVFAALVILGFVVAAAMSYLLVVFPEARGPGSGQNHELTVAPGEPLDATVASLERAGLLRSPGLFALYARIADLRPAPGLHLLTDDASPGELVRRLERLGRASRAKVTIPEGYNRFEIARRLEGLHVASARAFLEASADPALARELGLEGDGVEGFLFPATYELARDSDARAVVRRLVAEFERRYAKVAQRHPLGISQLRALGWGRREIVTLASMVEEEAAVDDERAVIASVFLNRLRDEAFPRHVLQCDPTAGYGCLVLGDRVPACAGYKGKITHAINVDPLNRYSTYVHEGLPPGPISNPGTKSLEAVLAPARTKYLYFVARGEGRRHAFSESLEEHNAAVRHLREKTGR